MRISKLQWAAALGAVMAVEFAAPLSVSAQVTERTFRNTENDNDWFNRLNWSPNDDYPDDTVHAIIAPVAGECHISNQETALAKNITINANKLLVLLDDSVFILGRTDEQHASYIHNGGVMEIGETQFGGATLRIAGDHTITGNGGVIEFQHKFGAIDDNNDPDDHLTITGENIDRDESLVVTGADGIIAVALLNNAFVIGGPGTIADGVCLFDHQMVGDCYGHWGAEFGGLLSVFTAVTGSAAWQPQNSDLGMIDGGTIQIGDGGHNACVAADGPVVVIGDGADLHVSLNGSFCTSGEFRHQSVPNGGSGTTPSIHSDQASNSSVSACDATICP
ncbi:MAG: hypothetical protein C4547_10245 [Phycisphaerales bacterium]|nr:MAG: hypothetical protein C4547_10245 [Phycisphaerales bacterium]